MVRIEGTWGNLELLLSTVAIIYLHRTRALVAPLAHRTQPAPTPQISFIYLELLLLFIIIVVPYWVIMPED